MNMWYKVKSQQMCYVISHFKDSVQLLLRFQLSYGQTAMQASLSKCQLILFS
jgi:hypothetical protein